jgi:hypothetical protein
VLAENAHGVSEASEESDPIITQEEKLHVDYDKLGKPAQPNSIYLHSYMWMIPKYQPLRKQQKANSLQVSSGTFLFSSDTAVRK